MSPREIVIAITIGVILGCASGFYLHGSPAPAPTVRAAAAVARVAVVRADTAVAMAKPANSAALSSVASFDAVRKRDTVVVDHTVYVQAAAADDVAKKCAAAIPKDTLAIAQLRVAVSAEQNVVVAQAAARPSRLGFSATSAYEPITKHLSARAETVVRVSDRFSIGGEVSRGIAPSDTLRFSVLGHVTFR